MNILFAHQKPVYDSLVDTASICFGSRWQSLPVRPRMARFVCGPSGSGKTHVARAVAEKLNVPFMSIDASSWMPTGANNRGARCTWTVIGQWLLHHPQGILFLDELDKIGRAAESWLNYIRVEMFSLLDRRIPAGLALDDEGESENGGRRGADLAVVQQRLAQNVFLIGAGAFQAHWETRHRDVLGFGPARDNARAATFDHGLMARTMPTELANRFSGPILVLKPLGRDDYAILLEQCVRKLPKALARKVDHLGRASIDQAVQHRLGVRWLEEIILQALSNSRDTRTPALNEETTVYQAA
jgi:hypothetical protein